MSVPSITAAVLDIAVGLPASVAGGTLCGIAIGGKSLGNDLAALMGGVFGPMAGVGGLLLGLLVLQITG